MPIKSYRRTLLIGGSDSALDGISGAILADGDICSVYLSGTENLYFYRLDSDSNLPEDSPNVITPDDSPGSKRFILQEIYTKTDLFELGDIVSIGNYNNNLSTAINTIDSITVILVINTEISLTDNVTVPDNITLWFTRSGSINLGNYDLTINGNIKADYHQIFNYNGSGEVFIDIIDEVYPQWWGAIGDSTTDCTISIQSAINSISYNSESGTKITGTVKLISGIYYVDSIEIKPRMILEGNGMLNSILTNDSTSDSTSIITIQQGLIPPVASFDETYGKYYIKDLGIETNGNSGISFYGGSCSMSKVENIFIRNIGNQGSSVGVLWSNTENTDAPFGEYYSGYWNMMENIQIENFYKGISCINQTTDLKIHGGLIFNNFIGIDLAKCTLIDICTAIQNGSQSFGNQDNAIGIQIGRLGDTKVINVHGTRIELQGDHTHHILFDSTSAIERITFEGNGHVVYSDGIKFDGISNSNVSKVYINEQEYIATDKEIVSSNTNDEGEVSISGGQITSYSHGSYSKWYGKNHAIYPGWIRDNLPEDGHKRLYINGTLKHRQDNTSFVTENCKFSFRGSQKLTENDTTPSVALGNFFYFQNSVATTVTQLDDGMSGQMLFIRFQDNITTIDFETGVNFIGNGGINWKPVAGGYMIAYNDGVRWNCICIGKPQDNLQYFGDADAHPSVETDQKLYVYDSTNVITVTNFHDGYIGQRITVVFYDDNKTIDFTGASLYGNEGVDWDPEINDHMTCVFDGSNWYCDISDNTA